LALLAGVVFVVFLIVTARLFVWSPDDRPTHANAIVALGGDPGEHRAKAALELARSGYARIVVISLGGYRVACPPSTRRVQVICFKPDPVNTRGEAEFVARMASRRHWRTIIVVPERTQTTRARLLFKRCTNVNLEMVPVSDPLTRLPLQVAYEWGALFKALVLKTSC